MVRRKTGAGLREAGAFLRNAVSPTSASLDAETIAYNIRAHQGDTVSLALLSAIAQTKEAARYLGTLPFDQAMEFIDHMEHGTAQATPSRTWGLLHRKAPLNLDAVAAMLRGMLDDAKAQVQALGIGALDHFI